MLGGDRCLRCDAHPDLSGAWREFTPPLHPRRSPKFGIRVRVWSFKVVRPTRSSGGPGVVPRRAAGRAARPSCATLWYGPWRMDSALGGGRLAQRESASFTPRRSLVRSQYRPPSVAGPLPAGCYPGALISGPIGRFCGVSGRCGGRAGADRRVENRARLVGFGGQWVRQAALPIQ